MFASGVYRTLWRKSESQQVYSVITFAKTKTTVSIRVNFKLQTSVLLLGCHSLQNVVFTYHAYLGVLLEKTRHD